MKAILHIQLHSFWHIGTGQGGGPGVDARIALTPNGLPCLPGKALKGLLRDALSTGAGLDHLGISAGDVEEWMGTDIPRKSGSGAPEEDAAAYQEQARFRTRQGQVRVSSARLDQDGAWEIWAATDEGRTAAPLLRAQFASTRIQGDGTAAEGSLRSVELAVPLLLHASLQGPRAAVDAIERVLPLIRALGAHRSRGLGRASFSLERGE